MPLLGPIGGGLAAFGASVAAGAAAGAAAPASSAARTTSLELFCRVGAKAKFTLVLLEVLELRQEVITKPEAAEAMLQVAMASFLSIQRTNCRKLLFEMK